MRPEEKRVFQVVSQIFMYLLVKLLVNMRELCREKLPGDHRNQSGTVCSAY